MEHTGSVTLTCPICKRDHSAPLYRRIDAGEDSKAREKLLDGDFFHFSCPDCGYLSELHYGCLYIDRDIRLLIYLAEEKETEAAAEAAARDLPFWRQGDSLLRVVRSSKDLGEKLRIFDGGLDDRLVEICKGMALSQFPSDDEYYVTEIRYDVIGQQEVLRLACSDGSEEYVPNFPSLYQQIYDQFAAKLPSLRGSFFQCVDLEYAAALMRGFQEDAL